MKSLFSKVLVAVYLGAMILPAWAFFDLRGGLAVLSQTQPSRLALTLFPLVGLYAMALIWAQLMIGSNRQWLRNHFDYPKLLSFHRGQGLVAFIFALTHPLLLLLGIGLERFIGYEFVAANLKLFVWLGYFNYCLIIATVSAALLRRQAWLQPYWRWIHRANYLLFWTVWIHSWFLGTDIQTGPLRLLWLFFAATALSSVLCQLYRRLPS